MWHAWAILNTSQGAHTIDTPAKEGNYAPLVKASADPTNQTGIDHRRSRDSRYQCCHAPAPCSGTLGQHSGDNRGGWTNALG